MLHIKHVTKYYVKSKPVISDMNLSFPSKGLQVIVGKSGCGKTTLLNMIGTMDQDYIGSIELDGVELSTLSYKKMCDYRNYQSAFIFQINSLFEHLTVEQNIRLVLDLQNNDTDIASILEKVGLGGFEKKKVKYLSGGERQRVGIARAIAKDSKIILADEPTSALDSKNGHRIFALLKEISKEKLVIIVTHDTKKAFQYADRIVKLVDGRVVEDITNATVEGEVQLPKKKASKPRLLTPIYWYQTFRSLLIHIFVVLLFSLALIVVNVAVEQAKVKKEYEVYDTTQVANTSPLRMFATHEANQLDLYHVVKANETDKPYTYFQETTVRKGELSQSDVETLSQSLSDYNIHYSDPYYGKIMVKDLSKMLKYSESYNGIYYYWNEPQRTQYDYVIYNEANEYNLLFGREIESTDEIMVTDTFADEYLLRNARDNSDLSVLLDEEVTVLDPYALVNTYYYHLEKPFKVVGIIETNQLQYYYYNYQSKTYNLLDNIVQQNRTDPYMNPAFFQPYGYIVTMDYLDAYSTTKLYQQNLQMDQISYQGYPINRSQVAAFTGYDDYKGISTYEDNLAIDRSSRIIAVDYSKIDGETNSLSGNQIILTSRFARDVFPDKDLSTTAKIQAEFNNGINGSSIDLTFKGLQGEVTYTFEVVGISVNAWTHYFYVSEDIFAALDNFNHPVHTPSITIGLEGVKAGKRIDLVELLYEQGYVLIPVNQAPGVYMEFVPTQGEIELVDDEGFSEVVNMNVFHLFSDYYNNDLMNASNYLLEILDSIHVFVIIMAVLLSLGFLFLKEKRQGAYTKRLTAMGVQTKQVFLMNVINYCFMAIAIGVLTYIGTSLAINYFNQTFVLQIADVETIGVFNRIRLLLTNSSVITALIAGTLVFLFGLITASSFVQYYKK